MLRSLGVPLTRPDDSVEVLREALHRLASERMEPVVVAWEGSPRRVNLRVPAAETGGLTLTLESGEQHRLDVTRTATERLDGIDRAMLEAPLPRSLPPGYHRLREAGGAEALLIAAPPLAHREPGRGWGLFAPVHWLRSERSWGVGDLTDLGELASWVERLGGELVATLPPLAAFLDRPCEPSPYAPVSRRFWNELFVDVTRAPELEGSPAGRRLVAGAQREIRELERAPLVDHRRVMALKRRVMERLAADLGPSRRAELRRFERTRPELRAYARFRAACEARGAPWTEWERPSLPRGLDPEAVRFHVYAQWLAEEQIAELDAAGHRLLLDLPLGVHPGGFDTWDERGLFVEGVSAGAPPDAFSASGQTWGFPPIHPGRARAQGHRYTIACVRHLLSHARGLRIDHVLGLHRLFWVPQGMPATHGAYVRYPWEELYAILCLESQRRGAEIVGEDLGTVPPGVRPAMRRHGLLRTYAAQTEVFPDRRPAVRPVPRDSLATVNTHDMPPFRSFWECDDIRLRRRLGLLDEAGARAEEGTRGRRKRALSSALAAQGLLRHGASSPREVYDAEAARLAASSARLAVLSLGDLMGETGQQNLPGTTVEHPNWRRRAARTLERAERSPAVLATLRWVDRARRKGGGT